MQHPDTKSIIDAAKRKSPSHSVLVSYSDGAAYFRVQVVATEGACGDSYTVPATPWRAETPVVT